MKFVEENQGTAIGGFGESRELNSAYSKSVLNLNSLKKHDTGGTVRLKQK